MSEQTQHVTVLKEEAVAAFTATAAQDFLDCTFGGGGHTEALLQRYPAARVVVCDRDARALARGKQRLGSMQDRLEMRHQSFAEAVVELQGRDFDGVLADLGVSTDQLVEERGFSWHDDVALDMRMNEREGVTAAELLNTISMPDLMRLLREGGVTQYVPQIARAIVAARPLTTAKQLAAVVQPFGKRGKTTHPAVVIFQAIRIAVNQEFSQIDALLDAAPGLLAKRGGVLCIISFHSLEDQRVTHRMRQWEGRSFAPANWRGSGSQTAPKAWGKLLTKKAVVPSPEEMESNPASRSARMRVFSFFKANQEY